VCSRWSDFWNFVEDMGEQPTPAHTVDRIDPHGHYCPENCRWATPMEQGNNRRDGVYLEWRGERKTLRGWSEATGIPITALRERAKAWKTPEKVLGTPPQKPTRQFTFRGESKSLKEWSRTLGMQYNCLWFRVSSGWSVEEAFTLKAGEKRKSTEPST